MDDTQELLADLYIVCQPIMLCSDTNVIDGYEVLLRSKKQPGFPEKTFLWLIEEEQRNSELLAYYSKELKKIIAATSNIKLALNLHPKQLQHQSTWLFLDTIVSMKENISIELTEHQCEMGGIDHEKLLQLYIEKLTQTGLRIAIDDVGTGQNNLQLVVKNVGNINAIKLSLTDFQGLNEHVLMNFLSSWLFLAEHYHLKMIVEGVENERISNELKKIGMVYQQGYYHGKAHVLH